MQRREASKASIAINTPASVVLGGAPPATDVATAAANAARRREALAQQAARDKKEAAAAAREAAERAEREAAAQRRAADVAANAARAQREASAANSQLRALWGGAADGAAQIREALAAVERHPEAAATRARLRSLLSDSLAAPAATFRISLEAEPLLMRVQGAVGLLLACGFDGTPDRALRLAEGATRQRRDLAIRLLA